MCTLYLLTPGVKAHKERGRIRVEKEGKKISSVLVRDVESLVVGKCAEVSTAVLFELMALGRGIFYVDGRGKLIGQLGSEQNSWERLECQRRCLLDEKIALDLIKQVLNVKIGEQVKILKYYAKQGHKEELQMLAEAAVIYRKKIRFGKDSESLRGMEGIASRTYFEGFQYMLDQENWPWHGRTRRPAQDAVNALLNYGYAFLEREVRLGIIGSGLDVRIGFLHSNNGRKDSLVFDLMEMFRQNIIDRLVLKGIHRKQLRPDDFCYEKESGTRLTEDGRMKWILLYEKEMNECFEEFHGLSPREYIRQQIRQFAVELYRSAAMPA